MDNCGRNPESDYQAEIKEIFNNPELLAAMENQLSEQEGATTNPVLRRKRWQEVVEVFGRKDID